MIVYRKPAISSLLFLVLAGGACAEERTASGSVRDIGTDHFAAGRLVEIAMPVEGDVIAAGEGVTLSSSVSGDVVLAARNVHADGDTGQNVYAAGALVDVDSSVGRNARIAGGIVGINRRAQIAGNASLAGGRVSLTGSVKGYLQAAGGRIYIDGVIGGDVEASGREVVLGPNARIAGALRYRSPNAIEQDPHAVVSGGVERLETRGPANYRRSMHRVGRWIWTIGLMVLAACLVAGLPAFSARASERVRERFLLNALLAFAVVVCVPVATIVLFATLIGAPLGLLTALAYPALLLLGYVSTGVALGDAVLRRAMPAHASASRWRAAFAALGTLAIALIGWLPLVGGIVSLVALLVGLGAFVNQVRTAALGGNSMPQAAGHD